MTTGIYVHVPFCRSRCVYCDFFSTIREEMAASYVEALCREITARRHELPHAHVRTIYFGGGTPSLLSPALLRQVLETIYEHYDVDADAEVTLEMNPDDWPFTVSPCKGEDVSAARDDSDLTALLHQGTAGKGRFNRVSLGIQSFDDALLRLVHRRHDAATAIQVVRALQHEGIDNISIDLIYGLPGQTMAQWEHDLDTAFSLGVQHLSAYALSYESGTLLTRWRDEGLVREVTDEQSVKMYERLCQRAREAGFEHYEISNFARPGFHSRHNSSYWQGLPYLGFGPGAHSYDGLRTRRANRPTLDEYLRGPIPYDLEVLTDDELYDEAIMCGLRTSRGIALHDIEHRFGPERLLFLMHMAEPHLSAGRLILDCTSPSASSSSASHLRLAESAIMISDDIMSDLMS
ncbi:MAG: radical SAM family heme chaperone HemW [Bacteroidaceae bacterium]|nr:radical SAM family heme chaperone HemW [Bacteroidaceae bacterium]